MDKSAQTSKTSLDKSGQPHEERVVLGMAASMGAFFMFTVMNVFAKILSTNHSVIEIAFYRNLIASVPFIFMVLVLGRRHILIIHSKPLLVGLRAVLGSVTIATTFAAYSLLPMADTTVLLFTSTLFIPVLGVIFLKEKVGWYRWAAITIGFAGVLIMLRPTGDVYTTGALIALTAALMQAIMQIILRYLGGYERPETVTFYFFVIGTLFTALPLPFIAVTPTLSEVPLLLGVGISGAIAQFLLSTAFRNATAVIVTVFNYSSIVWATLFGWLIWQEFPLPIVFTGAIIVIASNALVICRESRLSGVREGSTRAKF